MNADPIGDMHVIIRTPKLKLLYVGDSSLRWARAAATAVDRSIAGLCARQWRCVQVVSVEALRPPRRIR